MKFCDTFKKDLHEEINLKEEFAKDADRLEKLSIEHDGIYYDYSKVYFFNFYFFNFILIIK